MLYKFPANRITIQSVCDKNAPFSNKTSPIGETRTRLETVFILMTREIHSKYLVSLWGSAHRNIEQIIFHYKEMS